MEKNKDSNMQTARYVNETFSGCDMVAAININLNIDGTVKRISQVIGEIATVSYSINMNRSPIYSIGDVNAREYVLGRRTIAGSLVFNVFNFHFAKKLLKQVNDFTKSSNFLVDELPPFDLIVNAANEYGLRSKMVIYGIRLLNEGQVMSINDIYTENTYQFFATDIQYFNDDLKFTYNGKDSFGNTKLWTIATSELVEKKEKEVTSDGIYVSWENQYLPNLDGGEDKISKDYLDFQKQKSKLPVLDAIVKQPVKSGDLAIVTFTLNKLNLDNSNTIIIEGKEETTRLSISSLNCSTTLPSGTYYAQLESVGSETIKSNKLSLIIKNLRAKDVLSKYSPVVTYVSDNEVEISLCEPLHNTVLLTSPIGDSYHKAIRGKCKIDNLTQRTSYSLRSFGDDKIASSAVNFETLNPVEKMFENFERVVYSNSNSLQNPDITKYLNTIKEAKDLNLNCVSDSVITLKKKYINKLDMADSFDKRDILEKIKICSELIELALKINNDILKTVNQEDIKMPGFFYDSNKNPCIQLDSKVRKIEIYRIRRGHTMFDISIGEMLFKNIEGRPYCYKLNIRENEGYKIIAFGDKSKSPPLELFQNSINLNFNNSDSPDVSKSEEESIKNTLANSFNENLNDSEIDRLFLAKLKNKSNTLLSAPSFNVGESIVATTSIHDIQSNLDKEIKYYLSITDKDHLLNKDLVYKIPFTNKDELIIVDPLLNNIKQGAYVSWIENEDKIQISDASSFYCYDNSDLKALENDFLINEIFRILKISISEEAFNRIKSSVLYDSDFITSKLLNRVIQSVLSIEPNRRKVSHFVSEFKNFIGIITKSTEQIADIDIPYVKTFEEGTLLIVSENSIDNIYIEENETINITEYKIKYGKFVAVYISHMLNKKSKVIYVNNELEEVF